VIFVVTARADVITAHAALAVKERAGMASFVFDFDLLEKSYARQFRHWRFLEEPLKGSPISAGERKYYKGFC
jgi:hypothetical protein